MRTKEYNRNFWKHSQKIQEFLLWLPDKKYRFRTMDDLLLWGCFTVYWSSWKSRSGEMFFYEKKSISIALFLLLVWSVPKTTHMIDKKHKIQISENIKGYEQGNWMENKSDLNWLSAFVKHVYVSCRKDTSNLKWYNKNIFCLKIP